MVVIFLADLLSDPRFINCIEEMNGAVDNQDAMAFYAKCFSFVGRPRYVHTFSSIILLIDIF